MIVIGLTGGIGMGKTTVSRQLKILGAKICHADAFVHSLLGLGGGAVAEVAKHFPEAHRKGVIDRKALGGIVFKDVKKRAKLEAILHPLVVAMEDDFVQRSRRLGATLAVLDIPLLFETGAERRCDVTIVAGAPPFLQESRVLSRPHMTREKFDSIRTAQWPEAEKQRRADFIVQTGLGKAYSFRQVKQIVERLHAA